MKSSYRATSNDTHCCMLRLKNPKTDHVTTSTSYGLFFCFPLNYVLLTYLLFYSFNPSTWGHSPKDIEHVKNSYKI